MYKYPTYTAFNDGTHVHENQPFRYCTQKHTRKLPEWAKNLIIIETAVIFLLVAHLILLSNNL